MRDRLGQVTAFRVDAPQSAPQTQLAPDGNRLEGLRRPLGAVIRLKRGQHRHGAVLAGRRTVAQVGHRSPVSPFC